MERAGIHSNTATKISGWTARVYCTAQVLRTYNVQTLDLLCKGNENEMKHLNEDIMTTNTLFEVALSRNELYYLFVQSLFAWDSNRTKSYFCAEKERLTCTFHHFSCEKGSFHETEHREGTHVQRREQRA